MEIAIVLEEIRRGISLREAGQLQEARELLLRRWTLVEHGDAFARLFLAHTMADVQDDPREELRWDLLAMQAYHDVSESRASEQDIPGGRDGLLPSLHLNLAWDYQKLGQRDQAAAEFEAGRRYLHLLRDDAYGRNVRECFADTDLG